LPGLPGSPGVHGEFSNSKYTINVQKYIP
jgi:hypothetical protein